MASITVFPESRQATVQMVSMLFNTKFLSTTSRSKQNLKRTCLAFQRLELDGFQTTASCFSASSWSGIAQAKVKAEGSNGSLSNPSKRSVVPNQKKEKEMAVKTKRLNGSQQIASLCEGRLLPFLLSYTCLADHLHHLRL